MLFAATVRKRAIGAMDLRVSSLVLCISASAVSFCSVIACSPLALAEVMVATGHSPQGIDFRFPGVAAPAVDDVAQNAAVRVVAGAADANGGRAETLVDGKLPDDGDQPSANFFFRAGTDGGRLVLDFGRSVNLREVSSFSWHPGTRAPQVYTLYAAPDKAKPSDDASKFNDSPKADVDPASRGWRRVAAVDTRSPGKAVADLGGQHGATVRATEGELSNIRYLLFDVSKTESDDAFGNTFFSEIDAIEADAGEPKPIEIDHSKLIRFTTEDGVYRFTIDARDAPDLASWAAESLVPVVKQWYPSVIEQLPSDGFQPYREVVLKFRSDMGGVPASASRASVNLNTPWFRRELQREACGAVVHELVHVTQQYDRAARRGKNTSPTPGWLVEGIADYIRWYGYEPQSRGAEIRRGNVDTAKYDASYRITANFLNWVTVNHDKDIVKKLNAAAREGRYDESLWMTHTGKSVQELGLLWKQSLAR
jgi:hypothetical protein